MRNIVGLFILWLLPATLMAQTFTFPTFSKPVRMASELEGHGWIVLDTVFGDLNKDARADLVVDLEYVDSVREKRADSTRLHKPRILLILFRDSLSEKYQVVCQNNTIVARGDEDWMDPEKDPWDAMSIENGVLWMNFDFTRNSESYKFRYQKGDFYLIGAISQRWWANANEEYDVNVSTKKIRHYWTDPDPPHKEHTTWETLKPGPAIRLRTIKEISDLHLF